MSTALQDLPAVKQLIDMFECETPQSYRCVVTDWAQVNMPTVPAIIVSKVDVYDTENNFVKTADLSLLANTCHNFSFIFKKQ